MPRLSKYDVKTFLNAIFKEAVNESKLLETYLDIHGAEKYTLDDHEKGQKSYIYTTLNTKATLRLFKEKNPCLSDAFVSISSSGHSWEEGAILVFVEKGSLKDGIEPGYFYDHCQYGKFNKLSEI